MRRSITIFVTAVTLALVTVPAPSAAQVQVPTRDSAAKSVRDSAPRRAADSASRRAASGLRNETADTMLARACPSGRREPAEGLLLVTFERAATEADRAAAAKAVGGTLAHRPGGEDNEFYVHIPNGGNGQQPQGPADQLIRLPSVRMVGSAECPAVKPAPAEPAKPAAPPAAPAGATPQSPAPADTGRARP